LQHGAKGKDSVQHSPLPFPGNSFTLVFRMSIRLLALDLDGTLLNSRGQLTEGNRVAIEKTRERGVRVALVTGRRFRDARPIALELGLDVPLIAHNGALTKHARTLETVSVLPLPLAAARDALRVGRAAQADALVSDDSDGLGVLVYDHLSGNNRAVLRYIAWARRVHGDEGADAVREVPALEDYLDHDPVHLAFSGDCEAMSKLNQVLQRELGNTVKVLSTMYPKTDFALVDIIHPEASKGVGVAAVAAEFGAARAEVMAIGDNFNDLEMLRYAGTSVVMGNADSSLRQLEGLHTTASNDEDGVSLAIEKFILKKSSGGPACAPECDD
jgi:5-amino-6-(5-phospho-D-ribitylamino)uracil phosphatase